MIHLIFGAAATTSLKHALRKKDDRVIGFPIDFSIGPITDIHKESGIHDYFSWLNSSFHTMWRYLEGDQTTYYYSLRKLLEIEDGEQVTIWTCENATEQIGLRISCYLLKDKEVDLSYINTFQAIKDYTKHMDIKIDIRQTADCNAEQLIHFYEHSTYPITEKMKNDYVRDGKNLLDSKSVVRTWWNGEIVEDVETRDDSFILDCANRLHNENGNQEFINATKVIGEVLGRSEHLVSDIWIEYRIRSLIQSNQLAYEGDLQAMRKYKIKVLH